MINRKSTVIGLADIHCHIVPFVDDGADDMETAKELIREEYLQGVRTLVMTTHLRKGMFDTPIYKVRKHFEQLVEWVSSTEMREMRLFLSREYYCDGR